MPTSSRPRLIAGAGVVAGLAVGLVVGLALGGPLSPTSPRAPLVAPTGPEARADQQIQPDVALEQDATDADLRDALEALERRRGARVGLSVIDTATGERVGYREDERFAMASTVKVLLAAVVLDRLSTDELDRRLLWSEEDLVPFSPATELFVEDGMTVRQLIDASVTLSDNTATNVLFELAGGPRAVDNRLTDLLDDTVTSVDRVEPELNDWRPGEQRDTSTPYALADAVREVVTGDVLGQGDRALLADDLTESVTGAQLVRAGVPVSWSVGDKSGSATYGTRNDVAVVHPPGRAPWVVVVLTSHADADAEPDDALVARATRLVVDHWRVR